MVHLKFFGETLLTVFLIMLIANSVFAQQTAGGKRVKTGIWRNQEIEYVEGQIVVILKPGVTASEVSSLLGSYKAKIVQDFDKLGWGLLEVPESADIFPIIKALEKSPLIKAAEPNMVTHAHWEPNDPYFLDGHQWALKNTGQSPPGGTNDADIEAPEAWDITQGSSDIILAILDSGIPMLNGVLSHPDLDDPNKFILGPDFIDPYQDQGVRDVYGHGTHVTGIVSGETNNSVGIAGVAGGCKILVIQVFDSGGSGTHSAFRNGVIAAVDTGAKVINFSGGGPSGSATMEQAVSYADSNNVVLVASIGNDCRGPVLYPAAYSTAYANVIAVAATNHHDEAAEYSNEGPEVNVAAPGGHGTTGYCQTDSIYFDSDDIYSTTPNYYFIIQSEHPEVTQNYGYLAGTSMAAAHVTGVAGLSFQSIPICCR